MTTIGFQYIVSGMCYNADELSDPSCQNNALEEDQPFEVTQSNFNLSSTNFKGFQNEKSVVKASRRVCMQPYSNGTAQWYQSPMCP